MATKNIIPRNNDEGKIGTNSKKWGEAHVVDGRFDTLTVNGQSVSGGGATALNGLSDVTISSVQNNQVLKYNGSNWVNAAAPATLNNTDDLGEGSSNLYFTDERVDDRVNALTTAGIGITKTYDDSANTLTLALELNELSAAAVDVGNDSIVIIDANDSNGSKKETISDLITAIAGNGLSASNGVLAVGVDDASIEINSDALRIKASGVTSAMLAGNITNNKLNTITAANKVAGSAIQLANPTALTDDSGLKLNDTFAGTSLFLETSGTKQILHQVNTIKVTVSSGKFLLNGVSQKKIILEAGTIYRFDVSDSSVSSHPLKFSTTSDGTHNSGSEYTTGVTTSGSQGSSGAYVQLNLTNNTVQDILYYYCSAHSGMGSAIYTSIPNTDQISEGSSNLYFTNARADARISAATTSDLSEGTNLYFTNERVDDRVDALIIAGAGISKTYNDSSNTLTLASDATLQEVITSNATSAVGATIGKVGIGLQSTGSAGIGYVSTQSNNHNLSLDPHGSGIVIATGNSTRGAGKIKLNCENNSHGVTIQSPPHSAGATYTLTLPVNDGNADQVLKTNGSGVLSWVDQSSGGGGSSTTLQTTVTSTSTLSGATSGTHIWLLNGSTITVTLPSSGITNGTIYHLKNINSTKATISATIDGVTSKEINQYDNLTLVATGTGSQWYIL